MARALIRRPALLVLDEPVQGVDFAGEIALYELILKGTKVDGIYDADPMKHPKAKRSYNFA